MRDTPALLRSVCGFALLALLGGARSALAQASDATADVNLRVESTTCTHPLLEAVQRLTRVELNNAGLPTGTDAPRAILSCSERVVLIRVKLGEHEGTRQLDLDQTDSALRGRVIAIALAELVRETASGEGTPPPPPAVVAPPPPAPKEPAPPEPESEEPANRLVAFAMLSNFGGHFQPLAGGGLSFEHDFGGLALGLGPALAASDRTVKLGSVSALAANLAGRAALRFPSRVLPGEIGLGYALGWARVSATSASNEASASSVSGAWAGPFVFGALEAPFADSLFLQFGAQLGYVTLPVRGFVAQAPDIEIAGAWGGLSIGLGFSR